ncbi:hypothetical protein BT96DRAFT_1003146 [Gymnopus androsaceus JB14]|uniref:Uncharacterized protein n=1 Tax=Gymnopus androsaceus JB14 TaxID=1447944 RepID=A0A6A4GWM9_9AGAR|nr:hypothetical protein BT96DRAFT_1003146 [Gymnopus androsaceus JB14]
MGSRDSERRDNKGSDKISLINEALLAILPAERALVIITKCRGLEEQLEASVRQELHSPLPSSSPPPPLSPAPLEQSHSDNEIVPTSNDNEVEIERKESLALANMHQRDLAQLNNPAAKAECERLWQALPSYPRPVELLEYWNAVEVLIKAESALKVTAEGDAPISLLRALGQSESAGRNVELGPLSPHAYFARRYARAIPHRSQGISMVL